MGINETALLYLLGSIRWAVDSAIAILNDGAPLPWEASNQVMVQVDGDQVEPEAGCQHPPEHRKAIPTMGGGPGGWFCKVPGCGYVHQPEEGVNSGKGEA